MLRGMRSLLVAALGVIGALGGCGGRYPAAKPAPHRAPADGDGPRGDAAAALPYAIIDGHTGGAVSEAAFWTSLEAARVVCVGEEHPNPHHHWAQLAIVEHLSGHRTKGFGLGLEMVQRPFQAVLDDFAAGRIDAAALQSRVGWDDRWGYDWSLYEPAITTAVGHGGALIALNAAEELTKKAVHQGLEALTVEERAGIARELVLDDAGHRAWFDAVMNDLGGSDAHATNPHAAPPAETTEPTDDAPAMPSADRVYLVQVIWDETMAESASRWVDVAADRAMVVLAGNGHCHDSAIVHRVERRGVSPALSVRPIIDDGEGNVAEAIAEKRNDYLFVMTMPTAAE
jgi:uncharacterized iron-regulated protein